MIGNLRGDESSLNFNVIVPGPNFVSSFAYEDYVFFFYRETAVEYMNCGKVRFAIICILSLRNRRPSYATTQWLYHRCNFYQCPKIWVILCHLVVIISNATKETSIKLKLIDFAIIIFSAPNCNIFSVSSVFKCYPGKTDDKFVTSLIISTQWYHRRIVYSSVSRYGPRTSCQRKGLKSRQSRRSITRLLQH